MKEQNKQPFYVGIKNSKELRRNLLEASKSVIASMQKQQKISEIQKQKNKLKEKLKEDVKELRMLFSKLEKTIPEHVFETNEKTNIKVKPNDKNKILPKKFLEVDKTDNEINSINNHLEDIEQRLKRLKNNSSN